MKSLVMIYQKSTGQYWCHERWKKPPNSTKYLTWASCTILLDKGLVSEVESLHTALHQWMLKAGICIHSYGNFRKQSLFFHPCLFDKLWKHHQQCSTIFWSTNIFSMKYENTDRVIVRMVWLFCFQITCLYNTHTKGFHRQWGNSLLCKKWVNGVWANQVLSFIKKNNKKTTKILGHVYTAPSFEWNQNRIIHLYHVFI